MAPTPYQIYLTFSDLQRYLWWSGWLERSKKASCSGFDMGEFLCNQCSVEYFYMLEEFKKNT